MVDDTSVKVSDLEIHEERSVDFAAAAAHQGAPLKRTIEIDSSLFFDPYNIPVTAKIVYAVSKQFNKDRSKKLLPLHSGRWLLETDEINYYENVDVLSLNGEDLAKLRMRRTRSEVGASSGSGGSNWSNRENDHGIWHLQTQNTDLYKDTELLSYGDEKVAKVAIKEEKTFLNSDGRVVRRSNDDRSDELLVTLYYQADTERFSEVNEKYI